MSIPTPAGDAQAADPAPTTPAVNTPAPAAEEAISLDEARKLRRESQNLRERLKSFETAESERQAATLSKEEQLSKAATLAEKRAIAAEAALEAAQVGLLIRDAAHKAGIKPDLAAKLLTADDLTRDANGKFTSADRAVATLLKEHPELAATAINGSAANPARGATSHLTLDDVKRMSSTEINERWEEIKPLMAAQR